MKNKNTAALLALFFGLFGIHRFYLGQKGLGILYAALALMSFGTIPAIIGFIDFILLLTMDQREFDYKYNRKIMERQHWEDSVNYDKQRQKQEQKYNSQPQRPYYDKERALRHGKLDEMNMNGGNPNKINGIKKYKDYDFKGAIEDFDKALKIDPKDIALHFNLACCYSMTEDAEKGFFHLSEAVKNGFTDVDKIKQHDGLAFLRIQPEFDTFEQNGFRLITTTTKIDAPKQEDLLSTNNLLEHLKRLSELRERGLLTQEEFEVQKRKLLG